MTDRINGCIVAFDHDIREDDVQPIIAAIMQIRGVAGVTPNISGYRDYMAKQQVREEIRERLFDIYKWLSSGCRAE